MNAEERRDFVREHRTCVFGYARRAGPPSMSIVYYVVEDDEILVSTMADRAKAHAVARNDHGRTARLGHLDPVAVVDPQVLVWRRQDVLFQALVDLPRQHLDVLLEVAGSLGIDQLVDVGLEPEP